MIFVRRIRVGEGTLYKKIRVTSLADSPDAFATTCEDANTRGTDSWNEQANSSAVGTDRVTMLAFFNNDPVGIVALYRDNQNKESGEIIQLWVNPANRGGLVAGKLIEKIFFWARTHKLMYLSAWVSKGNERAIRFFRKYGFNLTNETKPFRVGSDLVSCLMTKRIRVERGAAGDADRPRR